MVFCLGVFGGMNKKVKYGLIGVIVFLQLHMIAGICVCLPKNEVRANILLTRLSGLGCIIRLQKHRILLV